MHSAVHRAHLLEPESVITNSSLSWSELKLSDANGIHIIDRLRENVNACERTINEAPHTCGSPDELTVRQFSDGVRLIVRAEKNEETCEIVVVARYTIASGVDVKEDDDHTYIQLRTQGGWNVQSLARNALQELIDMRNERERRVAEPQPQVPDSASKGGRNDQKKSILSVLPAWMNNGRA